VKSGESPEKSAATSYSRTSEYASLFEPTALWQAGPFKQWAEDTGDL